MKFLATRRVWKCKTKHPKQQFSAKVGTVFEDSPIGLDKWFTAVWMVANCKNGVSSYEIARDGRHSENGVVHGPSHPARDATGILRRCQATLRQTNLLSAASPEFMHKNKKAKITGTGGAGKAVVMGLLDRKSKKIRIVHVPNASARRSGSVREHVEGGS